MVFAGVYIMDARTEPGPGPLLNRELKAAEGVRAGLGPPLGGSRVVCRFGLFLINKSASPVCCVPSAESNFNDRT